MSNHGEPGKIKGNCRLSNLLKKTRCPALNKQPQRATRFSQDKNTEVRLADL